MSTDWGGRGGPDAPARIPARPPPSPAPLSHGCCAFGFFTWFSVPGVVTAVRMNQQTGGARLRGGNAPRSGKWARSVHPSLAGRSRQSPPPGPAPRSSGSVPSLAGWPSLLLSDKARPPAFPGVPVTGSEQESRLHHQLALRGQLQSCEMQGFCGVRAALRPPGWGGAGRPYLALGRLLQVCTS